MTQTPQEPQDRTSGWENAQPSGQPAPPPPAPAYNPPMSATMTPQDERTWAMLSHLAPFAGALVGFPFLGPLVVYLVYRERGPFVRDQSGESLNFQLTLLIGYLVSIPLIFVGIGVLLLIALGIGSIVLQILAALAANRGEFYRYPLTIRFVR